MEADSTDFDYENAGYPGGISDVYPGISADTIVWPSFSHTNYRLTGLGALGYAGVVLGPNYGNQFDYDNYLDFVDYELDVVDGEIYCVKSFYADHSPQYGNVYINGPGYINHNLHSSGLYAEGISYMSQIMNGMSLYFTARNRYDNNKNYYDIFVKQMLEETIPLITPDFGYVCFDDSYYINKKDTLIFPVGYYQWLQQNSQGGELENSINWYADNYKTVNSLDYLVPAWGREAKLQSILSYSNTSLIGGTIPNVISQGCYSNNDYTVLRSEINTDLEFQEQSAMWITHNEGLSYSGHEQGDQSSFVLWYKGQQLITDPGYFSMYAYNHNWCNSSFAHNVIQVENTSNGSLFNLDYYWEDSSPILNCYDVIGKIEPIGKHEIKLNPDNVTRNPITKCYQYESNDVSVLKVNLKYYNTHDNVTDGEAHEIDSETIDLFRNYYRIGENIYLIYDNIQRLESEPGTIDIANQLHFEAYASSDQNLTSFSNGKFELTNNGTNVNLFGTMGSLHNPETGFPEIKENLPFGQYRNNGNNDYAHRAMRLKTRTDEDEKFLTLLFPSEEADSPIYHVYNQDEKYGVTFNINNIYQGNQGDVVVGITNGEILNEIIHGYTTIVRTDTEFYQVAFWDEPVESNVGYVKSFIANSGKQLILDYTVIYESDSEFDNYEEVSVSYEDDVCHISLIPEEGNSPRCKIWRNEGCTTLDEEYISTHDFIAYDEDFFYIDYDQNDLPEEGVTIISIYHEDLIVSTSSIISNSIFEDNLTITVEENASLYLLDSNRFGENTKIVVNGNLHVEYIEGLSTQNTILTSITDLWKGIECYEGGQIFVQDESIIKNAEIGIFCYKGEIQVTGSTISNCNYGIAIYNDSSLEFDKSTINVPDDEFAVGILVVNDISECDIIITGDPEPDSSVIQSMGERKGTGINIVSRSDETENKLKIDNTTFTNLEEGIHLEGSIKTDDEILDCTFDNCKKGIYLNGLGSMKHIHNCYFTSNDTGIFLTTFKVPIIHCGFTSESAGSGIELDYVSGIPIEGPQTQTSTIDSCYFYEPLTGIICVNATPRVTNCFFDGIGQGIEVHNKSLIDLGWSANNVFEKVVNVAFYNTGSINIYKGHNDFIDGVYTDFYFNFDYSPPPKQLNCDYNYWSDRPLGEGVPYTDYIDIENEPLEFIIAHYAYMDDFPNVPPFWEAENRYEEAGILESEGNYNEALMLYKIILSELLEEEKDFWMDCIDRVFHLSLKLDENLSDLVQFYDTFILNIPEFIPLEEKEELIQFVLNYIKKAEIEMKNFQVAADIVVTRIEDPISTVDSLFAVMELENIYFLASMENGRANVSTSYPQHEPENCRQLQTWHDEHWEVLSKLLGMEKNNEEEIGQDIPLVPVLHNNYPNPFNPETTIKFSIPEDAKVKLTVYNIRGQKVKTLVNDGLEKGFHEVIWAGKNDNNKSVASGVYFYKFDVNDKMKSVKKCLLLK